MIQLDLFEEETKPFRYLSPEECVSRGYASFANDSLRCLLVPVDKNGNVTEQHPTIKTSIQQQWNVVVNGKTISSI